MMLVLCGLMWPALHAQNDILSNLEWDVYMQEFNDDVASRQQTLDKKGYTPSAVVDRELPQSYIWFVIPSMGFQWNREGGAGDFQTGYEGTLSAGDMLNHSYGLMVGAVKRYGGYMRYRYSKTDDPWVEMRSHQVRIGGVSFIEKHIYGYAGLGMEFYKYTNNYHKEESAVGKPWKPTTETDSWASFEAGLMGRWNWFILSAGMSYSFSGDTFDGADNGADIGFDLGVGFVIK